MLSEDELASLRHYVTSPWQNTSAVRSSPVFCKDLLAHIDRLTEALTAERVLADGLADSVAKLQRRRLPDSDSWYQDADEADARLARHAAARQEEP